MLTFVWPWMALLLPLPLFIIWLNKAEQKKLAQNIPVISFPKFQRIKAAFSANVGSKPKLLAWRIIFAMLVWSCLVVSLMRPELVQDVAQADHTGYDLMLAVDLSRSMDTIDFNDRGKEISRIAATKKVVANFVKQRAGDRIGLIVFAEHAFLAIPLTADTNTVVKMLNNLLVGMAGESTSIGDAIGLAVKNLRKRPVTSRVLILLTDGKDTSSHIPPLEAAKIAADDKIKIYTIGVGNELDDALLDKIATSTGGTYSKVATVDALEDVYNQIDRLEKSEAKQQTLLYRTPVFYGILSCALLCIIGFYLFNVNSKRYRLSHEHR